MTKTTTLDNGLRIVTQNMPGLETVAMGIWNSVGGRDELKKVNGVAQHQNKLRKQLKTSEETLMLIPPLKQQHTMLGLLLMICLWVLIFLLIFYRILLLLKKN